MDKILIIHNSALGDFVTFLPFLKLVKENYPKSFMEIYTRSNYAPLLISYDVNFKDIESVKWYHLFKSDFKDENLNFLTKYSRIFSFIGAEHKNFRENLSKINKNSYFIFPHNKFVNLHQSLFLINSYNFKTKKFIYPEININFSKHKQYFIIHPGSGSKNKNIPFEFFVKLSEKIKNEINIEPFFIGGENEFDLQVYHVKDLKELLEIFSKGYFYIGNDSGVSHLSTTSGLLTFTFFGPTSPYIWAPIGDRSVVFYKDISCSPCDKMSLCNEKKCLRFNLTKVFSTIKKQFFVNKN